MWRPTKGGMFRRANRSDKPILPQVRNVAYRLQGGRAGGRAAKRKWFQNRTGAHGPAKDRRKLARPAQDVEGSPVLVFDGIEGASPESVGKPRLGWMQESTGCSSLFAVSIPAGHSKGRLPFANPGDIKVELFTPVNGRGVEPSRSWNERLGNQRRAWAASAGTICILPPDQGIGQLRTEKRNPYLAL